MLFLAVEMQLCSFWYKSVGDNRDDDQRNCREFAMSSTALFHHFQTVYSKKSRESKRFRTAHTLLKVPKEGQELENSF